MSEEQSLYALIVGKLAKLVCLGCDENYLRWILEYLATDTVFLNEDDKMFLHSLDSWDSATDGLDLDKLRKIAADAESLMECITRLKKTPLVRHLVATKRIPRDDLLAGLHFSHGGSSGV